MTHTIILFDMDGILLHADGYHRALQESVQLIGWNLGIGEPTLTREHIAKFEAVGVTHEWETLAICSAILLTQIWRIDPNVRIPRNFNLAPHSFSIRGEDKYNYFLNDLDLDGKMPTAYAERFLFEREPSLNPQQREYLSFILQNGQNHKASPTLLVFQEYVLGSEAFADYFNYPPQLNTKSYLELFDQAALSNKSHDDLVSWLKSEKHHAVIFTNRPSKPPGNFFGVPEAELGAAAIGLEGLPIIGAGSLSWLASQESKPPPTYYKPSPVHALAAMQVALGVPVEKALREALNLFNGEYNKENWLPLEGGRIIVFEDLLGGLISAQRAQQLLGKRGIAIDMKLVGVSKHPTKLSYLSKVAHHLIEDINLKILPEIIS